MTDKRSVNEVQNAYPSLDKDKLDQQWRIAYPSFQRKIIVLDDDPTGVQTVHNISVYTDWSEETIERGFLKTEQMFFILTNSRAFTAQQTKNAHQEIATRIQKISQKYNQPFLVISRSDSTLRGHFPLETETLKQAFEAQGNLNIDGEIIIPYFKEGGRFTIDNVHYVQNGDDLVPAGETEFAKDRTFGFKSSHLGEWVAEKTNNLHRKEDVTYISLETIREGNVNRITKQLDEVIDFKKVVVNALDEEDLTVFAIALIDSMNQGKNFILRTGATFTKIIGDITLQKLLTKEDVLEKSTEKGGLVVIGSHVQKTTQQLKELQKTSGLHFIEFDVRLALEEKKFKDEVKRVQTEAEQKVIQGITAVIYTRRERLDLGEGMKEEELVLAVSISDALTGIVARFSVRPKYLIAKGGITSSDVGTKGLGVKRAVVIGQIAPGVPVWRIGKESKFPGLSYIIFPGNVGSDQTLKNIVQSLEE